MWDGQRDGFTAFLHYHRLDRAALEKLTFSLLGIGSHACATPMTGGG
jgi:hypothetical protein